MHRLRVYLELPTDQSSPTDAPKKAETTAKALAALSDPISELIRTAEVFAYSLAWDNLTWAGEMIQMSASVGTVCSPDGYLDFGGPR